MGGVQKCETPNMFHVKHFEGKTHVYQKCFTVVKHFVKSNMFHILLRLTSIQSLTLIQPDATKDSGILKKRGGETMSYTKTLIGILLLLCVMTNDSFAGNQETNQTLTGMYVNQENPKAPGIEFKESGVFLLYDEEGVTAHGTYEIEEGRNTLLLKLGNGGAIRFEFKQTNNELSFSHPKLGTWKKL